MKQLTPTQLEQLEDLFTYHAPTDEQKRSYTAINTAAKIFARTVIEHCPASFDATCAVWMIRLARMTANSSIACRGRSMPDV